MASGSDARSTTTTARISRRVPRLRQFERRGRLLHAEHDALANGTHTISWTVTDNLGNTEGIGSRFFTVQNGSGALTAASVEAATVASAAGSADGQDRRRRRRGAARLLGRARQEGSVRRSRRRSSSSRSGPARSASARREAEQVEVRLASQFDDSAGDLRGLRRDERPHAAAPGRLDAQQVDRRLHLAARALDSSVATSSCSSAHVGIRDQDANPRQRQNRAAKRRQRRTLGLGFASRLRVSARAFGREP